jgi:DNA-binding winged helix-turn-helix (wHTH) protein
MPSRTAGSTRSAASCGAAVTLQPKALELLLYLVRNRDRVVAKDELLDEVWPDAVVTESSLT